LETAERALLQATVREAVEHARAGGARAVDAALAELGWLEMLDAEPRDAIDIVFTALGATDTMASALDDVVVSALGTKPRSDLAVALPRFGAWDPPGDDALTTARVATAREVLVVMREGEEFLATTVPAADVELARIRGIDPDAGLSRARTRSGGTNAQALDPDAWDAAVASARRAIAHQIAGASRAMLDLARAHALERVQFGKPIARFQAVRHRLAEALVAVEALDATLVAAADEPGRLTAALAKAQAGRTARAVGDHCQQVLAVSASPPSIRSTAT
jgi:hypothetical protein